MSFLIFFFVGILFYRNVFAAIAIGCCSFFMKNLYISFLEERREDKLLEGFRDVLYSISGSVAAGRQMPRAMADAADICGSLYGDDAIITKEMRAIVLSYEQSHGDIEKLLYAFGEKYDLEEVRQFADSCRICKECGGDVGKVCLKSSKLLLDKLNFQNEIKTLISQKKLDIILLASMPVIILIFLNLSNYSYISVLYSSLLGRIIMSICLLLSVIAILWGMKIVNIKA